MRICAFSPILKISDYSTSKGAFPSGPMFSKQPKLIKCFSLEIPEWLKVYAKASPDLDQYLKVRY